MFHWPLSQIDATDMESLIPFVFHYPRWKEKHVPGGQAKRYADQVDFL